MLGGNSRKKGKWVRMKIKVKPQLNKKTCMKLARPIALLILIITVEKSGRGRERRRVT